MEYVHSHQHTPTEVVDSYPLDDWMNLLINTVTSDPNEVTGVVIDSLSAERKKLLARQVATKVSDQIGEVEQYEFGFGDLWRRAINREIITSPQGHITKVEYGVVAFQNLVLAMVGPQVLRGGKPTILYYRSVSKTATYDDNGEMRGVDRSLSAATYLSRRAKRLWLDESTDYDVVELALNQRAEKERAKKDPMAFLREGKLVIDSNPSEFLEDLDTGGGWPTRLQQELAMKRIIFWAIEKGLISAVTPGTFSSFKEFNLRFQKQELVDFYRRADIGPFFVKRVFGMKYVPEEVAFLEGHMLDTEIHMPYKKVKRAIPAIIKAVQRPRFQGYRALLQAARII